MGARIPRLAKNALDLIGNTPMVELPKISPRNGATILAKMESLNPAGSVKDRISWSMVEEAERQGKLRPGATIVEPTSGNHTYTHTLRERNINKESEAHIHPLTDTPTHTETHTLRYRHTHTLRDKQREKH